jgi:hypothetical protein
MAKVTQQLQPADSGKTCRFYVVNRVTLQWWNALAAAFENFNAANYTTTKYLTVMAETGATAFYSGTFPNIPAGTEVDIVMRADTVVGTPALATDVVKGTAARFYDGTNLWPIGHANATHWLGTALPTPDTAGYPKGTIKTGTGAGEIALLGGSVNRVTLVDGVTLVDRVTLADRATLVDGVTLVQDVQNVVQADVRYWAGVAVDGLSFNATMAGLLAGGGNNLLTGVTAGGSTTTRVYLGVSYDAAGVAEFVGNYLIVDGFVEVNGQGIARRIVGYGLGGSGAPYVDLDPASPYDSPPDAALAFRIVRAGRGDWATVADIPVGTGTGDKPVDHDGGTGVTVDGAPSATDILRYLKPDTSGAGGLTVIAYLASEYNANPPLRSPKGSTTTSPDGRWLAPLMLAAGTYTLIADTPGDPYAVKINTVVVP